MINKIRTDDGEKIKIKKKKNDAADDVVYSRPVRSRRRDVSHRIRCRRSLLVSRCLLDDDVVVARGRFIFMAGGRSVLLINPLRPLR